MRELLKLDGRPLIPENDRGRVRVPDAQKKAAAELEAYKERIRLEREKTGERTLLQIAGQVKTKRQRRASQPKKLQDKS